MADSNTKDFQDLVYARILAMPDGTSISIGDQGTLTKSQILEHIKSNDEIGQKMIEIEKAFFQALKEGTINEYAQ